MLIHPNPDPVAFALGPLKIHWYGLMYLVAFTQFVLLGRYRLRLPHVAAKGWTREHIDDMLFYGVLGVVLGGRLGEVLFYGLPYYLEHPLEILMVWKGGMSFHGGFLGVLIAMALWARRANMHLADVYDFIAPLVPLGYAAGRIGNFINHELPGRLASPDLPWAMIWPGQALPVHPSPIYQALVDGVLVFFILWWFASKARPRLAVGSLYVILYGCTRFLTEYFRTPDYEVNVLGLTISAGQMLSFPMIIVGGVLMLLAYRNTRPISKSA
ncbi:prolipoprotein diacylglyceryl transferase [Undibacterium rugosum]|uniref:Phosphatidylglycerol--prolipoprotein diacylglyceryl transferase n=1 Tax=Undibacterium rugosum TaxID=2762291 RepID=A0A923I1W1_9BURK|nr:prolipoprotein diacylglyceryl transferase [Undibacterium rugosum]MBC3936151.1 prolipoprotein diacylglyceryl transferase [Undibacterium rugosum]MBR7779216.1 prolipoprotein diacylglyceryl transferase [Undibacterium rugosum]